MTKRKLLKQRVRERMEKTGERYTAALRQVSRNARKARAIEEDAPFAELRPPGLACTIRWWNSVGPHDPETMQSMAQVLGALRGDPAAVLISRAAFPGQAAVGDASGMDELKAFVSLEALDELVAFATSLAAGVRGVSRDGRRIAVASKGQQLVVHLKYNPTGPVLSVVRESDLLDALPRLVKLRRWLGSQPSLGLGQLTEWMRRVGRDGAFL